MFGVLKIVGIIFEVLLIFNILIIVHELGHFLAAKWRGLYIERFGIWFGKPIWEKKIRGVWYSLGCIPAGGFVKLPQLAPMEALEGQTEAPKEALKPIGALDKMIVAVAGPLFSFSLAVLFAVLVYFVGRPVGEMESTTTIGWVGDGAPAAGILKPGDKILAIDGNPVDRWGGQSSGSVQWQIAAGENPLVKLKIQRGDETKEVEVKPTIAESSWYERRGLRELGIGAMNRPMVAKVAPGSAAAKAGFQPSDLIVKVGGEPVYSLDSLSDWAAAHPGMPIPVTVERAGKNVELTFEPRGTVIEDVTAGGPAAAAGLKKGDVVVAADGVQITYPSILVDYISSHGNQWVTLGIERGGESMAVKVKPVVPKEGGAEPKKPLIGIIPQATDGLVYDRYGKAATIHPGPWEQVRSAVTAMVEMFKKVSSPKSSISVQHMGGPVMMMRVYYLLFEHPDGWRLVLWFSVLINVNLALLNMLPLPVLDGGHIVLAIIEGIRRRPVNLKVLEWIQGACAMVIIGFILYITSLDVQDLFGRKQTQLRFDPSTVEKPE